MEYIYSQKTFPIKNRQPAGNNPVYSQPAGQQPLNRALQTSDLRISRRPVRQEKDAHANIIQRIISIRGRIYQSLEDLDTAAFRNAFGGHPGFLPNLSEAVVDNLDAYLMDQNLHPFHSFAHLLNECIPRANNILNINPPGIVYGAPPMNAVPIIMTGSRQGDYLLANTAAGLPATPNGFTWHHIQGIIPDGNGNYICNMILVDTPYHQQNHHQGGVYEYECATGQHYQ